MIYLNRVVTVEANEQLTLSEDGDITSVIIDVDLRGFKRGFTLDFLNEVITSLTKSLAVYQIHNSPNGFTITGQYR